MLKNKKFDLAESSRVSENVLEYYMRYGRERELEKFMRFRSPKNSSSSNSDSTQHKTTKNSSCEILNRKSPENLTSKSQSMPKLSSSGSDIKEHVIPIRLENSEDNDVPECITPPRRKSAENSKQTQTPESVAKVHKRLEWDSLADVGYEKSKSTSNISIVERMLLREFFEVSSKETKPTNSSENDIRHLEKEIADLGTLKKQFIKMSAKDESKINTPPLAHSTHYDISNDKRNLSHPKPKCVPASTNTTSSLQQKSEKYAQTSLCKVDMRSQEVQATLATDETTPFQVSSSVSSFEYKSGTKPKPSNVTKTPKFEHDKNAYSKSIEDILGKRKPLHSRNEKCGDVKSDESLEETQKLHKLYYSFEQMVGDEEKENNYSSTSSIATTNSTNATTIDFGIQLIFNIMKAKTVVPQQKKKLVKKIVKHVVKIANGRELHEIVRKTSVLFTSDTSEDKSKSFIRNNSDERVTAGDNETRSRRTESISIVSDIEMSSGPSTAERNKSSKGGKTNTETAEDQLTAKSDQKHESKRQTELNIIRTTEPGNHKDNISIGIETTTTDLECTTAIDSATKTTVTAISMSTTTHASSTTPISSSSLSSYKPPTQKPLKARDYVTGVKMQEWLKPVTQSEIEFEKKKYTAARSLQAKRSSSNSIVKREQQLNWIECEIERLQGLRNHLLVDEEKQAPPSSTALQRTKPSIQKQHQAFLNKQDEVEISEQLYDTVYSEQSKRSSYNAAAAQKTLESNSIAAKKNLPPSGLPPKAPRNNNNHKKQRSKMYTPTEWDYHQSVSTTIQRIIQELPFQLQQMGMMQQQAHRQTQQQQLHHHHHCGHCGFMCQSLQVENPTSAGAAITTTAATYQSIVTDDCGIYSQSMQATQPVSLPATYYTYPQTAAATTTTTTAAAGAETLATTHPQTLNWQSYVEQRLQYPQMSASQVKRQTAGEKANNLSSLPNLSTQSNTYPQPLQRKQQQPPVSPTGFLGSSELSVPMGSYGTSTTTTTTHQYDDVAATTSAAAAVAAAAAAAVNRAAVASQTGASLRRSRPIYETRCVSPRPLRSPHQPPCNVMPCVAVMATGRDNHLPRSTICIQTQPCQATAYALQFVVSQQPQSSSSTTSTASVSSASKELRILAAQAGPSLQEALQQRRPEFFEHAKERKSVINRIQKMRQEREYELRKIADENLSVSSLDRKLDDLPPPATERLRLFSTKEMKALSKKRISRLPEVVASNERLRGERNKRSNRLLRDVYNRRLKNQVRDGKLDFQHSRTLI